MSVLDDVAAIRATDASDMLGAVARMPAAIVAGYERGRAAEPLPTPDGVGSIVFCGMGGSAVAGDVLRNACRDVLRVPIDVNRSPLLPAFADPDTLVVVSSFSGETSETLSAFHDAVARGCRILAVTSGGTLAEECRTQGLSIVEVPGGGQPRAALASLTFSVLGALEASGHLPSLAADVQEAAEVTGVLIADMGPEVPTEVNTAKTLAERIGDRVGVVWGADGIGALAAMRWKTQLNENGKVPAWHAAMSELDHNEIVGWVPPYGAGHAVVGLRHDGEHREFVSRFPLSAQIALDAGATYDEVWARGESSLARLLSLIVVGDLVSCYVGLRRGIDPSPVDVISRLKAVLTGAG